MASKRQSEFDILNDVTGAYLSGYSGSLNYKIASSTFSLAIHTHNSSNISNASAVAGLTVTEALNVIDDALATAGVGVVTVSGITPVAADSLIGNPTGTQGNASVISLDSSLDFTGSILGVVATVTPTASALPRATVGGDLAAWIPDATSTVKGLVQFGGDLDATSTVTAQVVSAGTFSGTQLTFGAITDGQLLSRSGSSIVSVAAPAAATITSQANAEAGVNNTEIMSPLRTKQAATSYATLRDFSGYTAKSPAAGADTVLVNDSAAAGALKKMTVSDLVAGASGLSAASQAQTLALALDTVGVTPLGVAQLNAEYRMFSEQAFPTTAADVTIGRSITVCDTGVSRVFLPSSAAKIPTSVVYNDTTGPIDVYPFEGSIATGAYFNSNTAINFPRTAALGGLEAASMNAMTGIIEFTVDAWPVAGTGATLSRFLLNNRSVTTNDYRGYSISCIATGGNGYIEFVGYSGGNQTASFTIRSGILSLTPNTLTELVFSFNLATGVFKGYINGVSNAWDGVAQVFPASLALSLPATSMPLRVGHRSYDAAISTGTPYSHLGNMFRLVLWKDLYVDLDDPAVMALYRTAGAPVNIGKTGWRPRGSFTLARQPVFERWRGCVSHKPSAELFRCVKCDWHADRIIRCASASEQRDSDDIDGNAHRRAGHA